MGDVLSSIPPELLTGGGAAGIVVLAVLMVLTGRLVPRAVHEETRADRDAWRKAYDDVKQAHGDSEAARRIQASQLDELLESAKASEKIMTAMQQTLQNLQRRGGGR